MAPRKIRAGGGSQMSGWHEGGAMRRNDLRALPLVTGRLLAWTVAALGEQPGLKAQKVQGDKSPARADRYGDLLPAGALARLGTIRFQHAGVCQLTFSADGKALAS